MGRNVFTAFGKLKVVECGIQTILGKQLAMTALFNNPSFV